jgi:hypothetical protein
LSFFDEVDEPPRRPPRTQPRGSRPSGSGRPPRGDNQTIQTRRTVALVGVVIVIVILALLIHSCDSSENTSALRDYVSDVSGIVHNSNATASQLFTDLGGKDPSCSGSFNLHDCLSTLAQQADKQFVQAEDLTVPNAMQQAQTNLVATMRFRRDAMNTIDGQVQAAYVTSTAQSAVQSITTGVARLFASDVQYTAYAAPEMAAALHADGVQVDTGDGVTIPTSQVLTDLSWLTTSYIAEGLDVSIPGVAKQVPPTIDGYVAVGTNTMIPHVTNHVAAKPPPTFVITVTNTSKETESDVSCTVTVASVNISGLATIPSIAPGQQTSCSVTLTSSPPLQLYNVTAEVTVGPNAKNASKVTFPVQFLGS